MLSLSGSVTLVTSCSWFANRLRTWVTLALDRPRHPAESALDLMPLVPINACNALPNETLAKWAETAYKLNCYA